MNYYLIIFISSLVLCFFDFVEKSNISKLTYFCFCCFLILFVAFRAIGVDNDSKTYEEMFNFYSSTNIANIIEGGYGYVEKGYVFLNFLVFNLGGNFRLVLILLAILTGGLNYYYIYKKSEYPFLSLLFYLSFFYLYRDFTQIRYALAAALVFWSLHFYLKKSYLNFIIFLLLAVLFHFSAVIVIPALLFSKYVKNTYIYLLLVIPAFLLGKMYNFLLILITLGIGGSHMAIYENEYSGGSLSISAVGFVLVFLYFLILKKSEITDNHKPSGFYWRMVAMSVSLNLLVLNISIFQRFSFILFQYAVVLFPLIVEKLRFRIRTKEMFLIVYFLMSIFLFYYGIRMINTNLVRPYKMF